MMWLMSLFTGLRKLQVGKCCLQNRAVCSIYEVDVVMIPASDSEATVSKTKTNSNSNVQLRITEATEVGTESAL